jgi:hypothetical protein
MVKSCPVTLFRKVSAYGKNEMKREIGGEGRKREEENEEGWENRPDNRLLVFGAGVLLPRNFLG